MAMALTAKQRLFVAEYLVDLNATQAAIRAGYSPKTAQRIGSENLSKPLIQNAIEAAKKERIESARVDANYVLRRLVSIDQMDVQDILNTDGSIKAISDWPKVWRQTVSGVDITEMTASDSESQTQALLKRIKWPDKLKNLEILGKHIEVQAFKENIGANLSGTCAIMPVPTAASAEEWEKAAQGQQAAAR